MAEALVVGGSGYVGRVVAEALRTEGVAVTTTSRTPGRADTVVSTGADLDRLLAERTFDQVVHLPQLSGDGADWLLDRIDGARWLVFSSSQLASSVPSPGADVALAREDLALRRGATVLRPTMIFGRGGDANVSRLIQFLRRYRFGVVVGSGDQLLQPVHVDDVAALVVAHGERPVPGCFEVGGDQRITARALVEHLRRTLEIRLPPLRIRSSWVRAASVLPVPGLRPNQVLRLTADKVVGIEPASETFGWTPQPLLARLDQAVREVISRT